MQAKGKAKQTARIKAIVIRADGSVEDYGVIAGPLLQVAFSKIKRVVKKLWQQ